MSVMTQMVQSYSRSEANHALEILQIQALYPPSVNVQT